VSAWLQTRWMSPGEAADLTDVVVVPADRVQDLVFDALDSAEDSPGGVVVDTGALPRLPDHRQQGERGVGLDVQHMAACPARIPAPLLGGEHGRGRKSSAELVGNELART
jgi:hypothetical protein